MLVFIHVLCKTNICVWDLEEWWGCFSKFCILRNKNSYFSYFNVDVWIGILDLVLLIKKEEGILDLVSCIHSIDWWIKIYCLNDECYFCWTHSNLLQILVSGIFFCPLICLIVTAGNSAIILGLWLVHSVWTYYSTVRCFHWPSTFLL